MATNRLLPQQFQPGATLDGTRIEQALQELVALYNDVPPDLLQRRWSPSELVWGYSPDANGATAGTPQQLPWMHWNNTDTLSATLQTPTTFQNFHRAKSCLVPTITPVVAGEFLLHWEVSHVSPYPTILGALTCFAEWQATGPYQNNWVYGAAPPPGHLAGEGTEDFTLQATFADGWDLENRQKLRQGALVWQMRSDAFNFTNIAVGADTISPAHPIGSFRGFGVHATPLVLIPANARVIFQATIPRYPVAANSSWGGTPNEENAWNFCAQLWEACR